jgi:hypothetical protein
MQYLMHYAKNYREQRTLKEAMDAKTYVALVEIMLVRTANYVFANSRKLIFRDFMNNEPFDLANILRNIENC